MIAGAGLFSWTDSLRRSSKDWKPSILKERLTRPKETSAMTGPQNAIMLMILGRTLTKLFHESGAAIYEIP